MRAGFSIYMMPVLKKSLLLLFAVAVVFTATILPFFPANDFGLINLDDYWYVATHDPIIKGMNFEGIKFAFTDLGESIWMPLTWLSYMFDHSLFGFGNWGAFHLHSIILHSINACLVFLLLLKISGKISDERILKRVIVCVIGTLIWSVHPLRCESAVFIASRKDVLSFLFEIIALLCWFSRCGAGLKRGIGFYCASIVFFILGAMAKPSVMTFPLLCLLIDIFILRKVRVVDYIIPFCIAAVLGWFAGIAQAAGGATENIFGTPFWWKIVNAATSTGLYILNTVFPAELAPQCVIKWPDWPRCFILGIAICAVFSGWLAWRGMRYWNGREDFTTVKWRGYDVEWSFGFRQDPVFAGLAWFALAVAPMLGIAGFGYHSMADRFTYIPAVGLSLAAVAILLKFFRRVPKAVTVLSVFPILVLCAMTWRQTGYWKDDLTLFSRTLQIDGDGNAPAHGILANWHFEFSHDLDKCVYHFEKAIESQPRFIEACFQVYVFALCELGREKEVPSVLKMFDGWIYNDIEQNPRWGKDSYRAKFIRNIYQCSRIAYLITQPDLRAVAEDEIKNASCPKDDPTYLYLKWRLASAKGDKEEAAAAKNALILKNNRKGYTQFRYLNGGKDWER